MELAEKKRAIFDTTLALVGRYGFHGTPMSMIAKEAGVATGTIYHYFESKEILLNELYSHARSRVLAYVDNVLDVEASYREQFCQIWSSLHRFYTENPAVLFFFEQYVNSPYNQERSPLHFQGRFFQFLKLGADTGMLKRVKPDILLALFMGSVVTSAKLRIYGSIPFSDRDLHQTIELLWEALVEAKPSTQLPSDL